MNYFFSKEFYERAIAEEKKDSYYCEVSIKDFKGKISLLKQYAIVYPIWVSNVKISDMIVTIVVML